MIASRLNRRWARLSARSCSTNEVAWVEQRETQGRMYRKCRSRVSRSLSSGRPLWAGPVGSTRATTTNKQKGSGTPAGALVHPPRLTGAARAKRRALACRRSTTALAAANQRRSSAPERASWDAVGAHDPDGSKDRARFNGRYPLLPVPVQRHGRRPVIVPAGRFPEAARERR